MLLIKFPRVKPRLFHLYVFTCKIDLFSLEFGLAARPCETRREKRPRDRGLVSQAWSREKFETYF